MLSIDLFDSKFEKPLHEGAVDRLEQHRIDTLNDRMQELLARAKESHYKNNPEALAGLKRQYQKIKDERDSYYKIREAQQPTQTPAKGLLKNKDLVTPQQRVAGATPPKTGMAGAVKDVAGGLKRWLKGEPDQGPTYEQQNPTTQNPRALGVANFQRLAKANMGNIPTVNFEFIKPEENFKLDQRGLDLISDYYDGLENDQAKNYFIYRVLPSGDETLKVLKQLGWTPSSFVQQELPGIPSQGELPLSEKKKSKDEDNIKAGDVKVARELQKLRAQYPAALSDVEAVARAEIDSSERSQQQLAAIRGANEKQDALLKKLVDLDQEQGREINSLDNELERVQSTNAKLQQTIQSMTGTKKSAQPTANTGAGTINLIPGAPADVQPATAPDKDVEQEPAPAAKTPSTSPAIDAMARQIQGLTKAAPTIRPAPGLKAANEPIQQLKVAGSDIAEHGGGIGPKQHWQDLMPEGWSDAIVARRTGRPRTPYSVYIKGRKWKDFENDDHARAVMDKLKAKFKADGRDPETITIAPTDMSEDILEGIRDTAGATAVIACLLTGGSLSGCATAPQKTSAQQVLKTGQDLGRTVQTAQRITRAGVEAEVNQEIRNLLRGVSGRPEELNHSNILRIWRRIKGSDATQPSTPQNEAKEIQTRDDFVKERDRLLRMIAQETNPANKQILRSAIRQLENRAESEGWIAIQQRMVREDNASDAAEQAIIKRIMVAHTDLLQQYGPQKVMQAAEEVAYNVGDLGEIGTSDVSGWVMQVKQILGATA